MDTPWEELDMRSIVQVQYMSSHKLWAVWKGDNGWKVQFPKGILTFKTKREATRQAEGWRTEAERMGHY